MIQYVEDIEADDYGDHTATKVMDFTELSMMLVSVKPGEHHPAHWHEQGPHAAIFLRGEGTMRVGDTEFQARPGAVAIIPPASCTSAGAPATNRSSTYQASATNLMAEYNSSRAVGRGTMLSAISRNVRRCPPGARSRRRLWNRRRR